MNKIIFGGAFDPIHNGHINMAKNALKALPGEVIFLPARISVWKDKSAPIRDKMKMLELAIKDEKNFSIEKYEIESDKEVNYSIDTVKYLKDKYPDDQLYYLIGADQVNRFHEWKSAKELSEIARIVYVSRPGYVLDENNIKEFNMLRIEGEDVDVSSTEIRELKSIELPDEVLFYIVENDLYEGMVELKRILSPHRLKHSKSVAKTAYEIAKSNKLDKPLRYYLAGLLHDIGKDIPLEKQFEYLKNNYPEYIEMPKFSFHQFAGAVLAQEMFKIHDQDIIDAIKFHSTGSDNMDLMGKIIYAADKIEPTRGFDSSDLIAAMENDAEKGFATVLKANKDFLDERGKMTDNPLTCKCFNKYL